MKEGPLTLSSTLGSPYDDEEIPNENVISYDYAPSSREHENAATRKLVGSFTPVVYFRQVSETPSEYVVIAPMYIVGDEAASRRFRISAIPASMLPLEKAQEVSEETPVDRRILQKAYRERTVRQRLHQADFRRNVLSAYRTRCAVCELRIRTLLDGAHIIGDKVEGGDPVIQNGLSLCNLHHRAFDQDILLVKSDYSIKVGREPIAPEDRAAIRNIRDYEGKQLWLPRQDDLWPDRERLRKRFDDATSN